MFSNIGGDFDKILFNLLKDSKNALDHVLIAGMTGIEDMTNINRIIINMLNCDDYFLIKLNLYNALYGKDTSDADYIFSIDTAFRYLNKRQTQVLIRGLNNILNYYKQHHIGIDFTILSEEEANTLIDYLSKINALCDSFRVDTLSEKDYKSSIFNNYVKKNISFILRANVVEKNKAIRSLIEAINTTSMHKNIESFVNILIRNVMSDNEYHTGSRNYDVSKTLCKKLTQSLNEENKNKFKAYIGTFKTYSLDKKIVASELIKIWLC